MRFDNPKAGGQLSHLVSILSELEVCECFHSVIQSFRLLFQCTPGITTAAAGSTDFDLQSMRNSRHQNYAVQGKVIAARWIIPENGRLHVGFSREGASGQGGRMVALIFEPQFFFDNNWQSPIGIAVIQSTAGYQES
jgi:hypothetical protein